MSKSYNNVIPLLGSEKELRKSVMKIVTNSLEPGEPKDINDCTVFALYEYFASEYLFSIIIFFFASNRFDFKGDESKT